MNPSVVRQRFSPSAIIFHWITVVLIAAVYACILLRENYPKGSDFREGLKTWHFMLGLALLVLVVFRIIVRLFDSRPSITPEPAAWQVLFAKATHLALYAFMIGMPIAGWMILSASGKPIPFFGLQLPALVGQSESLAERVKELHETFGTFGYFLIGLHAVAALFHHYVVKDDTLRRMLPAGR